MRAFIAIVLEPCIAEQVAQWQNYLKQSGVCGRFTAQENLHLTLAFLGQTDRMDDALHAMQEVTESAFVLTVDQGGCFKKRGGDVLWMGVKRSKALTTLQSRLCERLQAADFTLEERLYIPHITLGRRMTLPPSLNLAALNWPVLIQSVREICLMESTRVDGRLCYLPRASVPLEEHAYESNVKEK